MRNYYFLGSILPTLSFDTPPEITITDFENLLKDNLTPRDLERTRIARQIYDVFNLRSLWLGESIDHWGNLDENELDEALLTQEGLPGYVYDFLNRYEKKDERLRYFPLLIIDYFQRAAKELPAGFLRDYLIFEREWRLVFLGFRAKKLGRDLSLELQFENPEEELISQLLALKDAKTFEPPEKYQELKLIFERDGDHPTRLRKALDQYRFNMIDKMVPIDDLFSVNRILAYMMQLIILEKWFEQDTKKGIEIVDKIIKVKS